MSQEQFLFEVLKGNVNAIALCEQLFEVSQHFDDWYDKDNIVSGENIQRTLWLSLSAIPRNPFYQHYFNDLQPIVEQAILDWSDANRLENKDEHGQTIAFILRDSLTSLVIKCAFLIGGYDWVTMHGANIRLFFMDEKISDYKKGLL